MTKNQTTITIFVLGLCASIAVAIFLPSAASLIIGSTFGLTLLHVLFSD